MQNAGRPNAAARRFDRAGMKPGHLHGVGLVIHRHGRG